MGDSFAFLLGLNMRLNEDEQGVTPAFQGNNPINSPFANENYHRPTHPDDVIDMPLQMDEMSNN